MRPPAADTWGGAVAGLARVKELAELLGGVGCGSKQAPPAVPAGAPTQRSPTPAEGVPVCPWPAPCVPHELHQYGARLREFEVAGAEGDAWACFRRSADDAALAQLGDSCEISAAAVALERHRGFLRDGPCSPKRAISDETVLEVSARLDRCVVAARALRGAVDATKQYLTGPGKLLGGDVVIFSSRAAAHAANGRVEEEQRSMWAHLKSLQRLAAELKGCLREVADKRGAWRTSTVDGASRLAEAADLRAKSLEARLAVHADSLVAVSDEHRVASLAARQKAAETSKLASEQVRILQEMQDESVRLVDRLTAHLATELEAMRRRRERLLEAQREADEARRAADAIESHRSAWQRQTASLVAFTRDWAKAVAESSPLFAAFARSVTPNFDSSRLHEEATECVDRLSEKLSSAAGNIYTVASCMHRRFEGAVDITDEERADALRKLDGVLDDARDNASSDIISGAVIQRSARTAEIRDFRLEMQTSKSIRIADYPKLGDEDRRLVLAGIARERDAVHRDRQRLHLYRSRAAEERPRKESQTARLDNVHVSLSMSPGGGGAACDGTIAAGDRQPQDATRGRTACLENVHVSLSESPWHGGDAACDSTFAAGDAQSQDATRSQTACLKNVHVSLGVSPGGGDGTIAAGNMQSQDATRSQTACLENVHVSLSESPGRGGVAACDGTSPAGDMQSQDATRSQTACLENVHVSLSVSPSGGGAACDGTFAAQSQDATRSQTASLENVHVSPSGEDAACDGTFAGGGKQAQDATRNQTASLENVHVSPSGEGAACDGTFAAGGKQAQDATRSLSRAAEESSDAPAHSPPRGPPSRRPTKPFSAPRYTLQPPVTYSKSGQPTAVDLRDLPVERLDHASTGAPLPILPLGYKCPPSCLPPAQKARLAVKARKAAAGAPRAVTLGGPPAASTDLLRSEKLLERFGVDVGVLAEAHSPAAAVEHSKGDSGVPGAAAPALVVEGRAEEPSGVQIGGAAAAGEAGCGHPLPTRELSLHRRRSRCGSAGLLAVGEPADRSDALGSGAKAAPLAKRSQSSLRFHARLNWLRQNSVPMPKLSCGEVFLEPTQARSITITDRRYRVLQEHNDVVEPHYRRGVALVVSHVNDVIAKGKKRGTIMLELPMRH
eukprot:gene21581-33200_t